MGDFKVRKIRDVSDRRNMYKHALNDVEAFEIMLKEDMFQKGNIKIGAEQELCIVNSNYDPYSCALEMLDKIKDKHFTNELALFNLEINLDPLHLNGTCFSEMETSLIKLLQKGRKVAKSFDAEILMTGILPTLKFRHLDFKYMTPVERYQTLSHTLSEIRGSNFEIYLQGVDEVILSLGTVLFEACNTSFQLHLQIDPEDFVNKHNWAQMITGPVLAACVNSPMLFGNELWAETRIGLFKQSLDTRSSKKFLRRKLPRVYFGNNWLQNSVSELWKNDIMRFPLLFTSDNLHNSMEMLEKGETPDLRAIRLHNGTTYTWNRLCYGFSDVKPHLRIECRYLPAGPTAVDEIANLAFWIGLMNCEPEKGEEFWKTVDFKVAKSNFMKAARTGLESVFHWFGENIPADKLILEKLLPCAYNGLVKCNVDHKDIAKYLNIIEARVKTQITGSDWTVRNFRNVSKDYGEIIAQKSLVHQSLNYQKENIPIHLWKDIEAKNHNIEKLEPVVEQMMSKDIISINEEVSIELAKCMLLWNNIHHLPVEDNNGDLVGIITDGMIDRLEYLDTDEHFFARDIMLAHPYSVEAHDTVYKARNLMDQFGVKGLPVVHDKKLVGIITQNDIKKVAFNS